jgi:hypothetical protein
MTQNVELSPFFERSETSRDGFPAESYVAGFREPTGAAVSAQITLPTELVEQTVLTSARLSVSLSPDGRLVLYGDGLDDAMLQAVTSAGTLQHETLETLVVACLDPAMLAGEDDAIGDLTSLRAQLVRALAHVDGTLERLKQR